MISHNCFTINHSNPSHLRSDDFDVSSVIRTTLKHIVLGDLPGIQMAI